MGDCGMRLASMPIQGAGLAGEMIGGVGGKVPAADIWQRDRGRDRDNSRPAEGRPPPFRVPLNPPDWARTAGWPAALAIADRALVPPYMAKKPPSTGSSMPVM